MEICAISDLHGNLDLSIPKCDLLLIAGDIYPPKQDGFLLRFYDWIELQPCTNIVFIAGNHDWEFVDFSPNRIKNCHYLRNTAVEIDGVKIFGCPWTLEFNHWAFNCNESSMYTMLSKYEKDLADSDIWLFHGPMYGFGDFVGRGELIGSRIVRDFYQIHNPELYIFGHNHNPYQNKNMGIYGVSLSNDSYEMVYEPTIIEYTKESK